MADQRVLIQTKLGQLRGLTKRSDLNEKTYYAFLGIPYGKPPLGELRFKAPQPYGSWEGIRDALEDGNDCKQINMMIQPGRDHECEGDEDCLYLNVYMNELPGESATKKPVIFAIPGGGFLGWSGSSTKSGWDYLMNGDAVVVSINYRCGAFGFLSLENEEVPGNAGLKDQTLGLKWVHDNIDSFGGDPNNVTIQGGSAGGASVHFQMLSPSARGLFHKAIIQCGYALNPWANQETPRANAIQLAKALGCESEDLGVILQFLQSVPADNIVVATAKMIKEQTKKTLDFLFVPCVEVSGAEPSLPDTPDSLMRRGEIADVPVILGCSVREGSVLVMFNGIDEKVFQKLNNDHSLLVPSFLGLKKESDEEKKAEKEIWDFYFKGNPLSWDNVNDYLLCESDRQFNFGMEQTRKYLVNKLTSPVYTYLYTDHSRCLCKQLFQGELSKFISTDTCHGADTLCTVDHDMFKTHELTPEGRTVLTKHSKAWTSFASSGDPNHDKLEVTWEKDSEANSCFMDMGIPWTLRKGLTLPHRISFWKRLSSKYCKT